MLWRDSYATQEEVLSLPVLAGHSLAGDPYQSGVEVAWVVGIGTLADFVREVGTWDRLMAEAFVDPTVYVRGVGRAEWLESEARAFREATAPSLLPRTYAWVADWTGKIPPGITMVTHIPTTGLTLMGSPTEDAWERFHAEMVNVLSGSP